MVPSRRINREAIDVVVGEPRIVETRDRAIGGRVVVEYPCDDMSHGAIPLRPLTEGRSVVIVRRRRLPKQRLNPETPVSRIPTEGTP